MNKDELKCRINNLSRTRVERIDSEPAILISLRSVLDLIDQLDEPEKIEELTPLEKVTNAFDNIATSIKQNMDKEKAEMEINALGYKVVPLDEPEKVIVPSFVGEWYEKNKGNLDNAIYMQCVNYSRNATDSSEFHKWFGTSKHKAIETLVEMKNGYTVEEKKYRVKLPDKESNATAQLIALRKTEDNRVVINKVKYKSFLDSGNVKLTEEEIKRNHEYLWPFAEEVTE